MGSPPKPWERNGTIPAAAAASTSVPATTAPNITSASTNTGTGLSSSSPTPPSVPARPPSFTSPTASASTTMTTPFTTSPFTAPYNRFGGANAFTPYTSSIYGGMGSLGGYGGGYGGYGAYGMNGMYPGAYSGMGAFGGQPAGMPFDPTNASVTQALESTTATTFTLLHSVVQTFAGLAQMLESTFMATHSSFFALAGVIDQFAQLRNALGSVLGLFGLVRWLRDILTGRRGSGNGNSIEMQSEFRQFLNGRPVQGPATRPSQSPPPPNASKKPLVFFFIALLGIPYAMHKLVKILAERAAQQQQQQQQQQQLLQHHPQQLPALDPSQLAFARTVYPFQASTPSELSLQENEIVAVMGKLDPNTGMEVDPRIEVETDWWKGRTREGREGWFPRKFVEVLERKVLEAKKVD
ncbi:Peroxin 13, N-terminal region-domain-containing protein [Russula emetica]|nr:Peroxin 13, N-terminal region-domain-containing protein [Russula emetica]